MYLMKELPLKIRRNNIYIYIYIHLIFIDMLVISRMTRLICKQILMGPMLSLPGPY